MKAFLDEPAVAPPTFTSPDWTEDGQRRPTPRPAWMMFGPDTSAKHTRTSTFFDPPAERAAAPAGKDSTSPAVPTPSIGNGELVSPEPAITAVTAPAAAPRPSAPPGGCTELAPVVVADLIGPDAEKRRAAKAARQDAAVAAWAAQPRPVAAEIDCAGPGEPEPATYTNAANALSTGCESPFAAVAMLEQVLRVITAINGRAPAQGPELTVKLKEIRALVQEFHPRDGVDGILAVQEVMFAETIGAVLARLAAALDPRMAALYATTAEKLTRAQLETLRCRERRHRAPRQSGQRITIRGQAQAVVGTVNMAVSNA